MEQVGLALKNPPNEEEQARRINAAERMITSGNLDNSWFGGIGTDGPVGTLTPRGSFLTGDNVLGSMATAFLNSGTYDQRDVHASRNLDKEVIENRFRYEVRQFLEETVPYMPAASQEGAAKAAVKYVTERGAIMGNSYVVAKPGEPSVLRQMFPGGEAEHPVAVNTAIVEWMNDPANFEDYPRLKDIAESRFWDRPVTSVLKGVSPWHETGNTEGSFLGRTTDFTVYNRNGQYIMQVPGHGSMVLPLTEIGGHYIRNR